MAVASNPSLTALLKQTTLDDHEEVLKASNAALKKSKGDPEAQYVRVVALIKLDRYEEALNFLEEGGSALQEKAPLEHAYALYKVGRLQEAAIIASGIQDQRGAQYVEAQARYRAEEFTRAAELYKALAAERVASEAGDLRVNQGAVNAQLQWNSMNDARGYGRPGREDLDAFETAYNAACGSIARGEMAQAEVLLKRAKELCRHSEDLAPEAKAEELLPICVQQIYVLQRLGKSSAAEEIVSEIQVDGIPDMSTRKIAQSNLLLTSVGSTNPFAAHKLFHSTPEIPEHDKLFSFQERALVANEKALDLQAFKFDGVATSTGKQLLNTGNSSLSPEVTSIAVLNAAAHARNEVGQAALKRVLPELEKRPNDVGLILTVVQMYITTANSSAAISLMESFFKRLDASNSENDQHVRFNPGLVSVLTSLYQAQGRKAHIKQELAKAASYWRHKSKPPPALLHAAGAILLESPDAKDISTASEIFSKLYEQDPEDKAAIAGYVASHAEESPDSGSKETEKLTPVSDLIRGVDVDALEKRGIPQSSNALAIAQLGTSRKRAAPDGTSTKVKRIRKSRLPRDYDPNKKPDPERWLPLRDRSTYRPKGKKKGRKGGDDRTQGGVVADDIGVNGSLAAKPSTVVVGGGGGNKKKKGKGKK